MDDIGLKKQIHRMKITSCTCLKKTPEVIYHEEWCNYRKLDNAVESFEEWFLSIPDVDESLLQKDKGFYTDKDILFTFLAYCQGLIT